MSKPLNEKQKRFAREYLVDLNATQAAVRAGYAPRTAKVQGSRLLTHAAVRRLIDMRKEQRAQKIEVTADLVLTELLKVATQEDVAQGTKVRACELLGKHIGMFADRLDLKVENLTAEDRAARLSLLLERARARKGES